MLGMCLIVVVLSVLGLAAAFFTHLVGSIDGLLMLMICLLMGGLFALMLYLLAKDEGWLPARHSKQDASTNPGAHGPGEGK